MLAKDEATKPYCPLQPYKLYKSAQPKVGAATGGYCSLLKVVTSGSQLHGAER